MNDYTIINQNTVDDALKRAELQIALNKQKLDRNLNIASDITNTLSSSLSPLVSSGNTYQDPSLATIGQFGQAASQIGSMFGPLGGAIGAGINLLTNVGLPALNNVTGKVATNFTLDRDLASNLGNSYSGSLKGMIDQDNMNGKKISTWFNPGKYNDLKAKEAEMYRRQGLMTTINQQQSDLMDSMANMTDIMGTTYRNKLMGMGQPVSVGRRGMKLKVANIVSKAYRLKRNKSSDNIELDYSSEGFQLPKYSNTYIDKEPVLGYSTEKLSNEPLNIDLPHSEEEIDKFKVGGKMNVIPEGALHARKHNMELDNITNKGIPVISESQGGQIKQHAEIERDEIIFRKEVTDKLEKLYEEFYNEDSSKKDKDSIALQAGKLLIKEILENTDDKTGLIDLV